jgi:site-specific recombinase XerD
MNKTVENALLDLRAVYTDSKFVFMNPGGTNHIYYRNFRCRIFVKDVKESGVSYFDLHGMRHTFAINYLLNGGTAHDLQILLGHENITTTMKYVKFTDEYLKNKSGIVDFNIASPNQVARISDYL